MAIPWQAMQLARTILGPSLAAIALVTAGAASAGTVQQITSFGSNPSGIGMYVYTPSNVATRPAIVVGVHACHGKGTDVCQGGNAFAQQADKWGFLLVCPSAVSSDGCWDVHSTADLSHDGGGDASGIISMVRYAVQTLGGDPDRVFAMGHSSGGMMTNVLLGSYPDVFKAGAAYAGVPFACFAQGAVDSLGWNTSCATGKVTKTGAQWGDLVRAAYPGFSGTRPRMQLWHGTTDDVLSFVNFGEEIKQWTNVLGVSETPTSTETNALQSTWIRTRYTDAGGVVQVEAVQETGQPHNLVVNAAEAIRFFGLDGSNPVPDGGVRDAAVDTRTSTGGASGTGGTSSTGGTTSTGGTSGSTRATGGAGGSATGATGTGGATSAGGTVGRGGSSTGGSGTGGSGSGGVGGTRSTGAGGSGTGGVTAGSGGSSATGGSPSTGGTSSSGGTTSSGGSSAGGGSGGAVGSGGATTAATGGTAGNTSGRADGTSGCSCRLAGSGASGAAPWVVVLGLVLVLRRRRR